MMFGLFNKQKEIKGEIGYFKLQDWWLKTFTKEERDHIEKVFQPLGLTVGFELKSHRKPLTEGDVSHTSQTAPGLLHALAGWFDNSKDRKIAKKIIDKAYEEAKKGEDILDLHFTLQQMIEIYYKERDTEPNALDKTIEACEEQINIAPKAAKEFLKEYPNQSLPAHVGFYQLVIILKKQGNYKRAIGVCLEAKKQGWAGAWDNQIESIKRKEKSKGEKN